MLLNNQHCVFGRGSCSDKQNYGNSPQLAEAIFEADMVRYCACLGDLFLNHRFWQTTTDGDRVHVLF